MSGYEDILNLPHHVSKKHPRMSRHNRAAQFSPFAALTGYDSAIRETARQTNRRMDLGEDEQAEIGEKLRLLMDRAGERPEADFVVFVPDARKAGGEYVSLTARVKRVDELSRRVILADGREISFGDILEIDAEALQSAEAAGGQPPHK